MNKEELIAKIMTEVSDEELRDKLLASVAGGGSEASSGDSVVLKELEKLGINPNAVKEAIGFQLKAGVVIGYFVGGLFLIGGGLIAALNIVGGNVVGAVFPGFFALAGWFAIASTRKMARLNSK